MKTAAFLVIDCESRSAITLKKSNVYNYSRHWSTEMMGYCYAFNDGPVERVTKPNLMVAEEIRCFVEAGGTVVAHNAAFERVMFRRHLGLDIRPDQCVDTMHLAAASGLPRSLEDAVKTLGLSFQKDMVGNRVMLSFSRPRKKLPCCSDTRCLSCRGTGTRYEWKRPNEFPDQWDRVWDYCAKDVEATRALYEMLPPLHVGERAVAAVDADINERGVCVDRPAAVQCQRIVELETRRLNALNKEVTGFGLSQTGEVTEWCRARDVRVTSLAKDIVRDLLALEDLDQEVRACLALREEGAKSSAKKVKTLLALTSDDSRLRYAYAFLGAISTGRWAGRGFQPQNLPRGTELKLKPSEVDDILSTLSTHGASLIILEWLRAAYGPPLVVISECLRGLLIPSPGKVFVGADLNAIEARVLAWLAQETWVLDSFRREEDLYVNQYALAFAADPRTVDSYQRLLGKVMTLALGYQGAAGAWASMARIYSVPELSDGEIKRIVGAYRFANPNIVRYWWACEQAAKEATANPGEIVVAGPLMNVRYCYHAGHLWCELPSKRRICYPFAALDETFDNGRSRVSLTYQGPHKKTRKWTTRQAYGGLLVENIVQAASSDLLRHIIQRLEKSRATPVVMHTHDEVTIECEQGVLSRSDLEAAMAERPNWASDLPIAAKGWTGRRYQK